MKNRGVENREKEGEISFVYFLTKEGLCLSLKMRYPLILESR